MTAWRSRRRRPNGRASGSARRARRSRTCAARTVSATASIEFDEKTALVLIFSSNRCPTAKAYADRMNELQRDFGPRGVQLVAINSNDPHLYPDERLPRMVERATEDGYIFPYSSTRAKGSPGRTAPSARSMSSCSTRTDGCAIAAGSTTLGSRNA